jgi:hypothetical protein
MTPRPHRPACRTCGDRVDRCGPCYAVALADVATAARRVAEAFAAIGPAVLAVRPLPLPRFPRRAAVTA